MPSVASKSRDKFESAESLEEAQARAEALFMSIGVGAIATDVQGKIYRINDVALKTLGYRKDQLLNRWFPKAIVAVDENGEQIPVMSRPITQAFLTGKPVSEKMRYECADGSQKPVSVTVSPILLKNRPIGAVEVFYDNSKEEEVDRMKSEFISIASHQLRTPLSAINTYANMLAGGYQGKLNPDQQKIIETIITSIDRMNQLITTLLDISQLEAGTLDVRMKETDLRQLLDRVTSDMEQFAKDKNLKFRTNCVEETMMTTCDPLLVGEIYTNLISNAIKYTPEKGTVSIKLELKKGEAIFTVKDSGYGIPKSMQKQVFSKFFRASNIKKKETSGTGLGLYMVKQIADMMGGRLWFESQEDKGSRFNFALPLHSTDSN